MVGACGATRSGKSPGLRPSPERESEAVASARWAQPDRAKHTLVPHKHAPDGRAGSARLRWNPVGSEPGPLSAAACVSGSAPSPNSTRSDALVHSGPSADPAVGGVSNSEMTGGTIPKCFICAGPA